MVPCGPGTHPWQPGQAGLAVGQEGLACSALSEGCFLSLLAGAAGLLLPDSQCYMKCT